MCVCVPHWLILETHSPGVNGRTERMAVMVSFIHPGAQSTLSDAALLVLSVGVTVNCAAANGDDRPPKTRFFFERYASNPIRSK